VYDITGASSHEAFIYNAARGRLDLYTFDIWNMNQCQCAYPQKGLDMCVDGELAKSLLLHDVYACADVHSWTALTGVSTVYCGVRWPILHCAGYYRWSINAFAYLRNVTAPHKKWVPVFDEPFISMDWARDLAPHRVGLVGESLFVHCQVEGPRIDNGCGGVSGGGRGGTWGAMTTV
jgi:hypothetical protein